MQPRSRPGTPGAAAPAARSPRSPPALPAPAPAAAITRGRGCAAYPGPAGGRREGGGRRDGERAAAKEREWEGEWEGEWEWARAAARRPRGAGGPEAAEGPRLLRRGVLRVVEIPHGGWAGAGLRKCPQAGEAPLAPSGLLTWSGGAPPPPAPSPARPRRDPPRPPAPPPAAPRSAGSPPGAAAGPRRAPASRPPVPPAAAAPPGTRAAHGGIAAEITAGTGTGIRRGATGTFLGTYWDRSRSSPGARRNQPGCHGVPTRSRKGSAGHTGISVGLPGSPPGECCTTRISSRSALYHQDLVQVSPAPPASPPG
nr:translation initiation factor IF-2-like [Taeniopygia guttata]XP_041570213.1 translation initiation factor IF-2-like [Taeniopygia guttata]XP_041570214.1 translation initiation factor IF-2-like [Taeniopygia guttata]XP_041570215.1 translation initiation factor IF-2-like [Taeniopygia guttata]